MELELEAAAGVGGGGRVAVDGTSPEADLGRSALGPGFSADRTVSRRHVSLRLTGGGAEPKLAFEVVGKNPVAVCSAGEGWRLCRHGETGELAAGDRLSLSLKAPSVWVVRRRRGEEEVDRAVLDAVERRERRTWERQERERRAVKEMEVEVLGDGGEDFEVEGLELDISSIDPVREFGFISMGHEFDNFPRGKIRPLKDWNWFLEEKGRNSDDEDAEVNYEGSRSKRKGTGKKKKGRQGDDDEWTGESEDEKDVVSTSSTAKRPKYATRSKDPKKPRKMASKAKMEDQMVGDEEYEEDEDETLGGFIVEEEEPMDEETEEEEEEEEFDEEEDD